MGQIIKIVIAPLVLGGLWLARRFLGAIVDFVGDLAGGVIDLVWRHFRKAKDAGQLSLITRLSAPAASRWRASEL